MSLVRAALATAALGMLVVSLFVAVPQTNASTPAECFNNYNCYFKGQCYGQGEIICPFPDIWGDCNVYEICICTEYGDGQPTHGCALVPL